MKEWWSTNALAAYGAIVGTVALGLNLWKFFYDRRKDVVRLRIACTPHEHLVQNKELLKLKRANPWDGPNLLPAYLVKVINDGAVPAHIANVWLANERGATESALVPSPGDPMILRAVSEATLDPLAPKSSRTFTVYARRDADFLKPKRAFVEDRTGQKWSVKC